MNIKDLKVGDIVLDLCYDRKSNKAEKYSGKITKFDYDKNLVYITFTYTGGYDYITSTKTYGKFWILKSEYVKSKK